MTELLPLANYLIMRQRPARFGIKATVTEQVGIRCPRCEVENPMLEHGRKQRCKCGLYMTVLGASLEVWE